MANQKISQLQPIPPTSMSGNSVLPVLDVSSMTSPAGETKRMNVFDLYNYINSGGLARMVYPYPAYQTANGLVFDESIAPGTEPIPDNYRCYGPMPPLGNNFSLFVRVSAASYSEFSSSAQHVIFGVGPDNNDLLSPTPADSAFIGIQKNGTYGKDLIAQVGGTYVYAPVLYDFFTSSSRSVYLGLTNDNGSLTLYVDGVATLTPTSSLPITNSIVVMGNGTSTASNVECTIHEAHIFNRALTATEVDKMFWGGVDSFSGSLISSYIPVNLNPGPTQWLDWVGGNHILLPTSGAMAQCPEKRFILSFLVTGSGYLGNGLQRDILPEGYFLKSCIVEADAPFTMSVGSSVTEPDSRVYWSSSSYHISSLPLSYRGNALTDKSIYVQLTGSIVPCIVSFDGYIKSTYNMVVPPIPTSTPTPTLTPTPSITPSPGPIYTSPPTPTPTNTPTLTSTPTLTPTLTTTVNSTPTPTLTPSTRNTSLWYLYSDQTPAQPPYTTPYWIIATWLNPNGSSNGINQATDGPWHMGPFCAINGSLSVTTGTAVYGGPC